MANINEIYSSTYKASDFQDEDVEFVISAWETKKFDNGKPKIALSFQGEERQFIVNMTNAGVISEMYGTDPDKWVGKEITLTAGKTEFGGKLVDCIRVKRAVAEKKVRKASIREDLDDSDSVPF